MISLSKHYLLKPGMVVLQVSFLDLTQTTEVSEHGKGFDRFQAGLAVYPKKEESGTGFCRLGPVGFDSDPRSGPSYFSWTWTFIPLSIIFVTCFFQFSTAGTALLGLNWASIPNQIQIRLQFRFLRTITGSINHFRPGLHCGTSRIYA